MTIICTSEKPWDLVSKGPVRHDAVREVGDQENGWPGGDWVTYECKNCGHRWAAELPQ